MTKGKATDFDKRIGIKMRMLANENNLTQQAIGKALGVTFQQVQKYLSGINRIPLEKACKFCSLVGITLNDLVGE